MRDSSPALHERLGRIANDSDAVGNILDHVSTQADDHIRSDSHAVLDAGVTTNPCPRPDPDRATDESLGHDTNILANIDVVSNVNEIVDPSTLANDRVAEASPIDAHVVADVHPVLDDHSADVRHDPARAICFEHWPEARAPDRAVVPDRHVVANRHILDDCVRAQAEACAP